MRQTVVGIVLLVLSFGCKSHSEQSAPVEKPQQGVETGVQKGGVSRPVETSKEAQTFDRVPSVCPLGKKVTSGDLKEVGGALFVAYEAALKGATPESLNKFLSVFAPDVDQKHIERYVFPRVVEHVKKYVAGDNDPSFVLCRMEKLTEDRVKVFVRSNDPKKSDPPAVLVQVDGKWLLEAMTP